MAERAMHPLRISKELKAKADALRGDVPFNTWVVRLIEGACGGSPDASKAAWVESWTKEPEPGLPPPPPPPKPRFNLPMGPRDIKPGDMLKGMKKSAKEEKS